MFRPFGPFQHFPGLIHSLGGGGLASSNTRLLVCYVGEDVREYRSKDASRVVREGSDLSGGDGGEVVSGTKYMGLCARACRLGKVYHGQPEKDRYTYFVDRCESKKLRRVTFFLIPT